MPQPFFNPVPVNAIALTSAYMVPNKLRLFIVSAYNANASARYIQLFDSVAAPTTGAVPLLVFQLAGNSALLPQVNFQDQGRLFTYGIWIVSSSTAATYTASGSNDLILDIIAS